MLVCARAARVPVPSSRDEPFDEPVVNPTCGYTHGVRPACNNCANAGLGANCLWDEEAQVFHGLADAAATL